MIKVGTHLVMGKKRYVVVEVWSEMNLLLMKEDMKIKVEATESTESEAKFSRHILQMFLLEPLIKNGSVKVVNDDQE